MATIPLNTLMMEQHGTLLLLQMECIPTLISMITSISIWCKSLITQQTPKDKKTYSINLTFILPTYRVLISIDGSYQLDLRGIGFGDLIGFEKKLVTKTEYGTKLPNITHSIDSLHINTSVMKDSVVNGINTDTIAVIPTDNLTRSYLFTFEPRRQLYCPVSSFNISEIRVYVTDSLGKPIDLNGIDWFMTLLLRSTTPSESLE